MSETNKPNWETVDLGLFPPAVQAAFKDITHAKERFENMAERALFDAGAIPAGMAVRFSDKWGKLSMAFVKKPVYTSGPSIAAALGKLQAAQGAAAVVTPPAPTAPAKPAK